MANTEMSVQACHKLKLFRSLNTATTLEQGVNWNVWRAVNLQYWSISYSPVQVPDKHCLRREVLCTVTWWISETVPILEDPGPRL